MQSFEILKTDTAPRCRTKANSICIFFSFLHKLEMQAILLYNLSFVRVLLNVLDALAFFTLQHEQKQAVKPRQSCTKCSYCTLTGFHSMGAQL